LSINYQIQIFVTQFREEEMVKKQPKMTTRTPQNQHITMFSAWQKHPSEVLTSSILNNYNMALLLKISGLYA
jgi:hypothetical protein